MHAARARDLRSAGLRCQAKRHRTGRKASRPLLAGAGGVRLQRPDPLGERAAALRRAAIGPAAIDGLALSSAWSSWFRPPAWPRSPNRPLECHRQLGDLGGNAASCVHAAAHFPCVGSPMSSRPAAGSRAGRAPCFGTLIARQAEAVPRSRPSRCETFRPPAILPPLDACKFVAQSLHQYVGRPRWSGATGRFS